MSTESTHAGAAFAPRWIEVGGVATHYVEAGEGMPVVFLHGGFAGSWTDVSDSFAWRPLMARLSDAFRCLAFDRLGQGQSGNPDRDAHYTMDASVEHAAGFLDRLGLERAHLVGHAEGGYVAARLALEHPERVASCTIVASATLAPGVSYQPHWTTTHDPAARDSAWLRAHLRRQVVQDEALDPQWVAHLAEVVASDKDRAAVARMSSANVARTLYAPDLRRRRSETHRWILERGIACPTLLVWGSNDPVADVDNAKLLVEMLAKRQPRTEFRILNRCGHYPFLEHPASVGALLRGFLRQ